MSTQEKQRLIRLIHVAKRELQLDDATYRSVLRRITGEASTKDATQAKLEKVLAHMKSAGFKVRVPAGKKPAESRPLDQDATSRKVRALWLLLHELGAVKNPAESALASYVRRIGGVDDLRWVDGAQAHRLIETLKKWCVRVFPAAIRKRWEELAAAGVVHQPFSEASAHLIARQIAGPGVGVGTFDSLNAVWGWLQERANDQQRSAP